MTTINQELYEALKEAGASEDAAKRAAASVYDKDQLATKTDFAKMRTAIEARLARLESDIGWIKWIITGGVDLYVLRSIVEWIR
jgi:hypothetical protein